ncbi:hypothetical protein BW737_009670 [Actinomyces ruminis]|uniref:TIGR03089 family protein n=1 Tax=Actinomyces ruminis TaxID=1937003 RepID=A0ABX4MAT4_9ACTO|nr:hypothetical protein BW737_009670 [Actinomyces ruminis]
MHDPLTALLPTATDADRAWLVWYAPGERVELTGRVLDMWQCKIANLLTEEAPVAGTEPGLLVHLGMGVHWRTVTWCCGAWLAGGTVTFTSPADVSVAFAPNELDAHAQLQVLVPRAALAMHWPGSLPPLVLDGVADVMSQPDAFTAPVVDGARAAVRQDATQAPGAPAQASRTALVAGLAESSNPTDAPDGSDSTERAPGTGARPRAALVCSNTALEAMRGVLAAWRNGLTAVLVSPDADAELIQAAARQEGA